MRFDLNLLQPGERPLREGRVPPRVYMMNVIIAGVAMGVLYYALAALWVGFFAPFVGIFLSMAGPNPLGLLISNFSTVLVVAFLAGMLPVFGKLYAMTYLLTNKRIIVRTGLFRRDVSSADLDRVQDMHVSQDLLDRLVGVGKVSIETAGTSGKLVLRLVSAPQDWVDAIHVAAREAMSPAAIPYDNRTPQAAMRSWEGAPVPPPADFSPGWHPDPLGRHQARYWDGRTWSAHVANDGHPSLDPVT